VNNVRMIFFWDREAAIYISGSGGTTNYPSAGTNLLVVYTGQSNGPTANGSVYSGYNVSLVGKNKRYQILKDMMFGFSPITGTANHNFHFKIPLHRIMGIGNASPTGATVSNNVGVLFLSDSSIVPSPLCFINMRLCYTT